MERKVGMAHHMGEEKIEQNVDRIWRYLIQDLGCGKADSKEIIRRFILRFDSGKYLVTP